MTMNFWIVRPPRASRAAFKFGGYRHVPLAALRRGYLNFPMRGRRLPGRPRLGDLGGAEAKASATSTGRWRTSIKTALASLGGDFEHVVKLTSYLTDIEANADVFREVRASYFPNKAALPASTLLQISRLANSAYLLEVEAIAILAPRA
jgi:hypothetical protein